MTRTVDIVFLYEHVAREMDVACAVKYLLNARFGLEMAIVQQPFGIPDALKQYHPRVVVLPFTYSNSLLHYPFLYDWFDAVYFNAAWEEIFYDGNRASKMPKGEFETGRVIYHAWADFFVEALISQGVSQQHIFLNGNPAYTLYDEPYKGYFDTRNDLARKHRLDPNKRWVFFPENYNWAFYADWRLQELQRFGVAPGAIDEMVQFCRESFQQVMNWCNLLAGRGDIEMIVRPRPAVHREDFFTAVQAAVTNLEGRLHIIKDGSVREWIMASDVVTSSYSTSLIEAAVAGKLVYMVEPVPVPQSLSMDWHRLLPHITTQAEFEDACLAAKLNSTSQLQDWARKTMMGQGDSISNLANYLASLCMKNAQQPTHLGPETLLHNVHTLLPRRVVFEYQRLSGYSKRRTSWNGTGRAYENDLLGTAEIARRVQKWENVLNRTLEP